MVKLTLTALGGLLVGLVVGQRTAPRVEVSTALEVERRFLHYILADGTRGVDTCYTPINVELPAEWRPDSTRPAVLDSSLMVPYDPKTGQPWDSLQARETLNRMGAG